MQIDAVQGGRLRAGIGKSNILESNSVGGVRTLNLISRMLRHLVLQEFSKIRQIEIVFIHTIYRGQAVCN